MPLIPFHSGIKVRGLIFGHHEFGRKIEKIKSQIRYAIGDTFGIKILKSILDSKSYLPTCHQVPVITDITTLCVVFEENN